MPVEYTIDSGVIVIKMYADVTSAQFADYLRLTENDPNYRRELPRLVLIDPDARFPASTEIMAAARETPRRSLPPNIRFACVATSPFAVGIASMFMGHAGLTENFQIFDNSFDARRWLTGGAEPSPPSRE